MSKYAEWRTLQCGNCEWLFDIATIADKRMDPDCEMHQQFHCTVCGDLADGATIRHGTLTETHKPQKR